MKKLLILIFISFSATIFCVDEKPENIQILKNNIYALKKYLSKLPREDQRNMNGILNHSLAILKEMEKEEEISVLDIIDDISFEKVYEKVKNTWPDRDRIDTINISLQYARISSQQLLSLVKLLDFDDSKIKVITNHMKNITDKYNSVILLDEITNSLKRRELAKKLKSISSEGELAAIDDISFEQLFNKVKKSWPDKNKIEAINVSLKYAKVSSLQLYKLVSLLQHDYHKKEVIFEFKNQIIDKYNSYILLDAIDSISVREEISNELSK